MTRSDDPRRLDERTIQTIRALAIDATQESGDGHPGMPMGAAPMGYLLYRRFMTHSPANPLWWNRDRYVQSAGHGSMLQYSLLHLTGYDLPMEELRGYRQWGSRTPGHPEHHLTPGVETTTGPLGQGIATAVGMAIAEAHLAERYNRPDLPVVDHRTYVIASDGDLMEGVSHEASSLAGHLGLGKLIVLYDDNGTTIDGPTHLAFSEDVIGRYDAYGWHTQRVSDGNDLAALEEAIRAAEDEPERPSLIAVRTVIGFGSPNRAGSNKIHGSALGDEEATAAKRNLGIDWPPFTVPDDVLEHTRAVRAEGSEAEARWNELWGRYRERHPELAAELERAMDGRPPDTIDDPLPRFAPGEKLATRKAFNGVLNHMAGRMPELIGGSADLAGSNYTDLDDEASVARGSYGGRVLHFGVREHAMAAAANGMALHQGVRPFVATFLVFSDYLRPSLRLSALMGAPVLFVFTHDSIGLGGDGPTHQPEGHLPSLRAMPNLVTLRPADGNETAQALQVALHRREGPTALALTRQGVPHLDIPDGAVRRGGYVLAEAEGGAPRLLLIGTGSEVSVCLGARQQLQDEGVPTRVVSMPSWELFAAQSADYREQVLPAAVGARLAVEAAATLGWERWVGARGEVLGVDRFGHSAPGATVLEKYGFTPENVANRARALLEREPA